MTAVPERNREMEKKEKNDRRIRRTKRLLTDTLLTLLETKKIKNISVKELCEMADVNRGTFYLHYSDIYEMMEQMQADLLEQLDAIFQPYTAEALRRDPYPLFYDMFQFTAQNARLLKILLGSESDVSYLSKIKAIVKERFLYDWLGGCAPEDQPRLAYSYDFIAAGWTGLIESWLFSEHQEPIEEMAALASSIISVGMRSLI